MPHCRVEGCKYANGGPEEAFIRDASKATGFRAVCREHRNSRRRNHYQQEKGLLYADATMTVAPPTVDALLDSYGLNQDEWEVSSQRVSVAPGAKGIARASRSITVTKRKPLPVLNVEQVQIKTRAPWLQKRTNVTGDMRIALIVPDGHIDYVMNDDGKLIPFHDRKAWDVVCQVADEVLPDTIVYLGDMIDCPAWTDKFFHPPNMGFLNIAMRELLWWTDRLLHTLNGEHAQFIYLEGNHENRIGRIIGKYAKQGWDLRQAGSQNTVWSVPHLLKLDELGIRYVDGYPAAGFWLNENLVIKHGHKYGAESGESMKRILNTARCSEIIGHVHRCERASKTLQRYEGTVTYTACTPGTLADLRGPIPRGGAEMNWQNGFAVVQYEEGNGGFQINLHEIYNGECIFNGKKLRGEDHLDLIRNDIRVSHLA